MPCKHKGGEGVCVRRASGDCKVGCATADKKYSSKISRCTPQGPRSSRSARRIGVACELLVQADLLTRDYEVTFPLNPIAQHDLHVEFPSVGWVGVQVKAASLNTVSGSLYLKEGIRRLQSPVVALVHLPTSRIAYRAGTKPLPPELQE